MRVAGRLQHADYLPYDSRCPIILPRNAWVTKLLVKREHEKGHHVAGVSHTFADLLTRFWIPSGREVIREWEQQCAMCQRKRRSHLVRLWRRFHQLEYVYLYVPLPELQWIMQDRSLLFRAEVSVE